MKKQKMTFSPLISPLLLVCIISLPLAAVAETGTAVNGAADARPDKVVTGKTPARTAPRNTASKPEAWVLYAEQWDMRRSGDKILALPVLRKVVNAWLEDRTKFIEIQYPGGEEGEFWVQELTDWLVSLGIPSEHMIITPGSGGDDMIKFALRRA